MYNDYMYYDYDFRQLQQPQATLFPGFPGGGGLGNVNRRLDRLERQVERNTRDINRLERRVNRIERQLGFGGPGGPR